MNFNEEHTVFFASKKLKEDYVLIYQVEDIPNETEKRHSYRFELDLIYQGKHEQSSLDDVTASPGQAERFFDLLVTNHVHPCHLENVIADLLSDCSQNDAAADDDILLV